MILDDYANTRVEIDNDYDPIPVEEHIINENKRRSKGMILDFKLVSGSIQVKTGLKLGVKVVVKLGVRFGLGLVGFLNDEPLSMVERIKFYRKGYIIDNI